MRLTVPYHSQEAQDAKHFNNDCGAACASMVIEWAGLGRVSVDALALQTNLKSNDSAVLTPFWVQSLLERNGLKSDLKTNLNAEAILSAIDKTGCPAIAFVFWGDLPNRPAFPDWFDGHYVVVNGYEGNTIFVNDPDFWGSYKEQGKDLRITREDLNLALSRPKLQGCAILVTERPSNANPNAPLNSGLVSAVANPGPVQVERQIPIGEATVAVDSLWLRAAPAGAQIKLMNLGDRLVILNVQPVVAPLNNMSITWVNVVLEGVADGWCAESGLLAMVQHEAKGG